MHGCKSPTLHQKPLHSPTGKRERRFHQYLGLAEKRLDVYLVKRSKPIKLLSVSFSPFFPGDGKLIKIKSGHLGNRLIRFLLQIGCMQIVYIKYRKAFDSFLQTLLTHTQINTVQCANTCAITYVSIYIYKYYKKHVSIFTYIYNIHINIFSGCMALNGTCNLQFHCMQWLQTCIH